MKEEVNVGARPVAPPRGRATGLRLRHKVLPEYARPHNRSLVLQQLFGAGPLSRAQIARATGLTRVTVSDLVGDLLAEGLVEELETRTRGLVGKPAILLAMRSDAFQVVVIDLADAGTMRGGVTSLVGEFRARQNRDVEGRSGDELLEAVAAFASDLVASATAPVLGVGIGSPGVIDSDGRVVAAPNRGWSDQPLARILTSRLGLPVHVANDADTAMLAEFTFGAADEDGSLVLKIGEGVGAGIILGGDLVSGARHAAGEVGHVRVVEDGALPCACGRYGCLETVLSVPALRQATRGASPDEASRALASAGRSLGLVLAPVFSALNLSELLLAGPADLVDGPLLDAAVETIRDRTLPSTATAVTGRMVALRDDVVLSGAAVLVISRELGVS